MRVLVLGAEGLLGSALLRELKGAPTLEVTGADRAQADVASLAELRNLFAEVRPDAVVHGAAYTDVDGCEADAERAFKVNALGTRNVAQCCEDQRARLLYLSTDYVFDGTAGRPYREFDRPNPLGVYAKSKFEGEFYASHLCRRFAIVRTSWLFGSGGRSFPVAILERARRGEELRVVDDQVGSPTYVPHLAKALRALVEREAMGVYHVTGGGRCSWFDFARRILEAKGLAEVPLTAISTAELGRPAPRPAFSVLDNANLSLDGYQLLPHWHQGLAEHLGARP